MPVAELSADGGRIDVDCQFREKELIKQVPGAKWDNVQRTWYCHLSWASCLQLRGVFRQDLQVGVNLANWARAQLMNRVQPCMALREEMEGPDVPGFPGLYPYQKAGVAFMATAGQCLNGDEMGTGKTVQTIAAMELLGDAYPALIICPNSVKDTWGVDEFKKWAPHRKVVVIGGSAANRKKALEQLTTGEAEVGVINWESIRIHSRLSGYGNIKLEDKEKELKELNHIPFATVVADEAHRAKNPQAKSTRAAWWLMMQAKYRFALTGTPVANAPDDLWSIMHSVAPTEWPSKTGFIDRYALQSWGGFGFMEAVGIRIEMKDELFKILDPRFIRRTKAQVLPWLPEKVPMRIEIEMSGKQKTAYEAMRKEMIAELQSGILIATNPLAKLTRLMQFASAYGEIVEENGKSVLKLTEPSCKVDALMDVADELGGKQAIVFAESKQLIDLAVKRLLKEGYKVGQITGGVSTQDRTLAKDAFQNGDLQILCLTMAAGGVGLTLTAAEAEIFLQRSFNFVHNKQAEDRAHRPGLKHSLQVIDIITKGTVDLLPHESLVEKAITAEQFNRDADMLAAWLAKGGPELVAA